MTVPSLPDLDSNHCSTKSKLPVATVKVVHTTVPAPTTPPAVTNPPAQTDTRPTEDRTGETPEHQQTSRKETWCDKAKGKKLQKKGSPYTLPSGEICINIPNSVIEDNKKAWDYFVLGQFYHEPPTQGTVYNIVNGIWSKNYRDITVSKLEGHAFLFRIPNAATRNRVIRQRLWQIEGQTMFVDKWEPGVIPAKPELSSAPIWLELRNVPLQFFNEDSLERIAGLVEDPKFLHPNTANKTVLDVAKVFTIIDPRKPLPEAVNVRFDSGDIARILVSSPWMPPICNHCQEIGHITKRCKRAPITCAKSTTHTADKCTRKQKPPEDRQHSRRNKTCPPTQEWRVRNLSAPAIESNVDNVPNGKEIRVNAQSEKTINENGDSSGLTPSQKRRDTNHYDREPEVLMMENLPDWSMTPLMLLHLLQMVNRMIRSNILWSCLVGARRRTEGQYPHNTKFFNVCRPFLLECSRVQCI